MYHRPDLVLLEHSRITVGERVPCKSFDRRDRAVGVLIVEVLRSG